MKTKELKFKKFFSFLLVILCLGMFMGIKSTLAADTMIYRYHQLTANELKTKGDNDYTVLISESKPKGEITATNLVRPHDAFDEKAEITVANSATATPTYTVKTIDKTLGGTWTSQVKVGDTLTYENGVWKASGDTTAAVPLYITEGWLGETSHNTGIAAYTITTTPETPEYSAKPEDLSGITSATLTHGTDTYTIDKADIALVSATDPTDNKGTMTLKFYGDDNITKAVNYTIKQDEEKKEDETTKKDDTTTNGSSGTTKNVKTGNSSEIFATMFAFSAPAFVMFLRKLRKKIRD